MVMGMRPPEVMDAELQPQNLASEARWAFPPTLLMAARNDQNEIIELVNRTEAHLESQARKRHVCCLLSPFLHISVRKTYGDLLL
jgi:hypothetical protein